MVSKWLFSFIFTSFFTDTLTRNTQYTHRMHTIQLPLSICERICVCVRTHGNIRKKWHFISIPNIVNKRNSHHVTTIWCNFSIFCSFLLLFDRLLIWTWNVNEIPAFSSVISLIFIFLLLALLLFCCFCCCRWLC